jgi:hypothetical protein
MKSNNHLQDIKEQRLAFRLLSYWDRVRLGRKYPALSDINISEIKEMWHFSFTINVSKANESDHEFLYFGPQLVSIFNHDLTGEKVTEAMNDVILNNTIGSYLNCFRKCEPTMDAGAFYYNGREVKYRTLFVPLSSDGANIDYIMGTTNHKMI